MPRAFWFVLGLWLTWFWLVRTVQAWDCTCTYRFGAVVETEIGCSVVVGGSLDQESNTTASQCSCIDATNALLPLRSGVCPGTVRYTSSLAYDAFAVTSLCSRLVPARLPRLPAFLVPCEGAECNAQSNGTRTRVTAITRTNETCSYTRRIETCIDPTPCVATGCVVSPWSIWSGCSRTCNEGIQVRTRQILRTDNVTVCPVLRETLNCSWLAPCPDAYLTLSQNRSCTLQEQAASPCGNATQCYVKCTSGQGFDGCRAYYPFCNASNTNATALNEWWNPDSPLYVYRQCGVHATSLGPPCTCVSQTSVIPHSGLPCNGIEAQCRPDELQYSNQTCRVSVPWSQRLPSDVYDQNRELTRSALPTDVVCNDAQRLELCGRGNVSQCRWPYVDRCVCAPGTLQDGYRCLARNESYTRNCTDDESRVCTRCDRYSSPGICASGIQCLVDCNGNSTGCVRRNSTCTEITLQVLQCDTRDRIRYCGESAVGCTWEVLYDPSRGILQRFEDTLDCYCGPMAISLPAVEPFWNYGRPCATALTYQVPCTVAQMRSGCNTTLTQESTRLNEDPRFCLQRPLALALSETQRIVPGTCPSEYRLRNCTAEELYRYCPLPNQIGCQVACPLQSSSASNESSECRRWGECTVRRECTVPEAARYCGKFGVACEIDLTDQAGIAGQVVLNASSCVYQCQDPWYGPQCRNNYNNGPCTVERGTALCGGPWQWFSCTSLAANQVECGCREGYGNPVPTALDRNASIAYVDTQIYGYCAGTERQCANETERFWYAGDHALNCTLWCATAQPDDCRLGSYQCSPFSFPETRKGFFQKSQGLVMDVVVPCATRTVYVPEYDADPTVVQSYCGRGARSMAASVTYRANGSVALLEFVPGSCVCQANFFASDTAACDATFYVRPCTDVEVSTVPRELRIGCPSYQCRRLCYPARGERPELCFAHAPDACLDHVSIWASLPTDLALSQCGDYVSAAMARCVFRSDLSFSRVCSLTNVSCHCATTDVPRLVYQNTTALTTLGGGIRPCDELYDVQPCVSRAEAFVLCGVSPFALNCTKRVFVSKKPSEAHVCQCESGFASNASVRVCATRIQGEVCDSIGNAPCGAHTLRIDYACINQTGQVDCTPLCTCLPDGVTFQGIPCGGIRRECTEAERRSICNNRTDLNCQMDCEVLTPASSLQKRACTLVSGACALPRVSPAARRVTEAPAAAVRIQCGVAAINCTWDVVFQKCIPGTCVCVSGTTAALYQGQCVWRHNVFRSCSSIASKCGPTHVYGCRERRVLLTSVMTSMMGFATRARSVMVSLLVNATTQDSLWLEPNPTVTCRSFMSTAALRDQALSGMRSYSIDDDLTNVAKPYWAYLNNAPSVFSMAGVPSLPASSGTTPDKCMPDGFVAADGRSLWRPVSLSVNQAVQTATSELWLRECLCQSDPYALQPGPPSWWSLAVALNVSTSRIATEWSSGIALNPYALQDRLWCNYELEETRRRNGACPVTSGNNLACNGLGVCSLWRQSVPVVCRQYRETYASCITNVFRTQVDGNAPVKAFVDLEGFASLIGANRSIFDTIYRNSGPLPSNFATLVDALSIPPPGAPTEYASYVDFARTLLSYTQRVAAAATALDAASPLLSSSERRLQDYGPCTDYINQVATGRVLPGVGIPLGCRAILETDLMTNSGVLAGYLPQHVFRAPFRDERTLLNKFYTFVATWGIPFNLVLVHQILFSAHCGTLSAAMEAEGGDYSFTWVRANIIPIGGTEVAIQADPGASYSAYYTQPAFGIPSAGRWTTAFLLQDKTGPYSSDLWSSPLYVHPFLYTGWPDQLNRFRLGSYSYLGFQDNREYYRSRGISKSSRALFCSAELGRGQARIGTLRGGGNCTEFRSCYYTALTDVMSGAYASYRLGAQTSAAFRLQYGARFIDTIISRITAAYRTQIGSYKFGMLTSYQTIGSPIYSTASQNLFSQSLSIRDYYFPLFYYWNTQCKFSPYNPLQSGLPTVSGTTKIQWPFLSFPWRTGYTISVQALNVWRNMVTAFIPSQCAFCDAFVFNTQGPTVLTRDEDLRLATMTLQPAAYIQELIASQSELMSCFAPFTQDFVIPEPTEVVLGSGCSQWSALASFCDTSQAYTGSCEDVLPSIQQIVTKVVDVTKTTLDQRIPEIQEAVRQLDKYTTQVLSRSDTCQSLSCRNCTTGFTGPSCAVRSCNSVTQSCYPGFVGLCPSDAVGGDLYQTGRVPTGTCCHGQTCILPLTWTGRVGCINGYFDWFQNKCICDEGWEVDVNRFGTCTKTKCPNYILDTTANTATNWPISPRPCFGNGVCLMSNPNSLSGVCQCNDNAYGASCEGRFEFDCGPNGLNCNGTGHGVCVKTANNLNLTCVCASSNYDTRMGPPSTGCPETALPGFTLDTTSGSGSRTTVSQCRYVRVLDYTYTQPIRAPAAQTCTQVYCDYFGRCGCSVPNYTLSTATVLPSTLTNTTANPSLSVNFSALCPPTICPYPYRRDDVTLSVQCACILDRYVWPADELTYEWRGAQCNTPWAPCQNGGTAVAEPSSTDPHRIVCRCPVGYSGLFCEVPLCPRSSSNVTCNGYRACDAANGTPRDCRRASPVAGDQGKPKCVRPLPSSDVDYFTGGCLCDKDLRTFCRAPGSEALCSGDQRPDGREVCVPQVNLLTQRVEYTCNCSEARQGTYCQEARCPIPPELQGYLPFPCNGRTCVYSSTTQTARCQCNKGTVLPLSLPVLAGENCEYDVTAVCGYNPPGTPFQSLCNNRGTCVYNISRSSFQCVCQTGYTGAVCQLSICQSPCAFGTCVPDPLNPSGSICRCTHPTVIGYNETTGSCTANQCGAGFPSSDGTQCVCADPTRQPPQCLQAKCVRVDGQLCGPFAAGDIYDSNSIAYADGTRSSRYKYCTPEGQCVCNPFLYNTSSIDGTCIPKCNQTQTVGAVLRLPRPRDPLTGLPLDVLEQCVCQPGFTSESFCSQGLCLPNQGVFDPALGQCVCRDAYNGTRCADTKCGSRGTPNADGSLCICNPPWIGDFCDTLNTSAIALVCANQGRLVSSTPSSSAACQCIPPFTGPTCEQHTCIGGVPGPVGSQLCVCNSTEWTGSRCEIRLCRNGGTFVPEAFACTCPLQYTGPFCEIRRCSVGGNYVRVGSFEACLCTGLWQRDAYGNCTDSYCVNGVPSPLPTFTTCTCTPPYVDVGASVDATHRCQLLCSTRGNYSKALRACVCEDGYHGLLCEKEIIGSVIEATNGTQVVTIPLTPSQNVTVTETVPGAGDTPNVYQPNATLPMPGGGDLPVPTTPTQPNTTNTTNQALPELPDPQSTTLTTLGIPIAVGGLVSLGLIVATSVVFF